MPRRKRGVSSKLPSRVRLLGFLPLAVVLLERLWVPMQMSRSPSPAYFSSARSKDNKRLDNEKIPRLADVTKTTGDWMKCPSKTRMVEKSIAPQRPGATSTIPLVGIVVSAFMIAALDISQPKSHKVHSSDWGDEVFSSSPVRRYYSLAEGGWI